MSLTRLYFGCLLALYAPSHSLAQQGCFEKGGYNYTMDWVAMGTSFFDDFEFGTQDANHGASQYLAREEAHSEGVVSAFETHAIVKVGAKGALYKRKSAYLTTKKSWDYYLAAMKFTHVPWGCGVWPAFWTNARKEVDWPEGGEVDLLEYANDFLNKVSLHTGKGNACRLDAAAFNKPGCTPMPDTNNMNYDCFTMYPDHLGCAPNAAAGEMSGQAFAANPGVIAVEKTDTYMKVFWIPQSQIPSDLENNAPKPDSWDQWVISYYPLALSEQNVPGSCPLAGQTVQSQQLIINIGLCGDWASAAWINAGSCVNVRGPQFPAQCKNAVYAPAEDCCTQFIWDDKYGAEEYLAANAFFNITWLKVFTDVSKPPGPSPAPSPTPPSPSPSSRKCSAHPKCSGLGGNCCPTDAGHMLGCCEPPAGPSKGLLFA